MAAFLESLGNGIYILRTGPDARKYGDPYTASGTVVTIEDGVCEVRGFTRRSDDALGTMQIFSDMKHCLKNAGFKEVRWERYRKDGHNMVTVKL